MARVIGLDLSLTATGMAWVENGPALVAHTYTIRSFGHRGDPLVTRHERLDGITTQVRKLLDPCALLVIEGGITVAGGSNWDRAGLWWRVVDELFAWGVPVAVAQPTVVKKFAAGKGNADKASVAAGITRLWPAVEPNNDNEFDALALAHMGALKLGLNVPSRAHHAETLAKVQWPEGLAAARGSEGDGPRQLGETAEEGR